MRIATVLLCDYAGIREGLLTVASGGITRMFRDNLPSKAGIMLALVVEVDPGSRDVPHELSVGIAGPDGAAVAQVTGGFQLNPGTDAEPDEILTLPIPLDLRDVPINEYGWYTLQVSVDGGTPELKRVKVVRRPAPASGPPMPLAVSGGGNSPLAN